MHEVLLLICIALIVFLLYSNTLEAPYILDDEPNIHFNNNIRINSLSLTDLLKAGFESASRNRPVANISFALNYYFHRYSVTGYHLVNILIHITTGLLLYFFIKSTVILPSLTKRYAPMHHWLPVTVAFIWLVHPIQIQSVTYMVQRMNSLAAMFYIMSMLCYVQARQAESRQNQLLLFGACLGSGILALGSKEIAATLPFFILLYEWYFFRDLDQSWLRRNYIYPLVVFLALAVITYLYLDGQFMKPILAGYGDRDFTPGQRLLTEFRVVVFYLSLIFFPHPSRLNLDHHFALSNSLLSPVATLLSIAAVFGLIALAIGLAQRQRLLSFSVLWFLGNLLIESSLIGLEIAFEHRNYLPSMMLISLTVTMTFRYLPNKNIRRGAIAIALLFLSIWTYERNHIWGNEIRLWADSARKSPQKARPHNNLGTSMFKQGHTKEAIINYSKVLQIEPDHAIAHNNLGFAMNSLQRVKVAITHYSEALRIKPNYERANRNLSAALRKQPHLIKELRSINNIDPAESHLGRGLVLADMGGTDEALEQFSEALRINPDHGEVHFQRGRLLIEKGRIDEAIHHFSEALQIDPDDADAYFNMGVALARKGRVKGAIKQFEEALRLNPVDAEARQNMFALQKKLATLKRAGQAASYGSENLRIKPDYKKVHFDLEASRYGESE